MTVLAQALEARYDLGTNLKGRGAGATWALLLESLDVDVAVVSGRIAPEEVEALARLAAVVVRADETDVLGDMDRRRLDLVRVGRGGAGPGRQAGVRDLADRLAPAGTVYVEGGRRTPSPLESWAGPVRRFAVWPAFGPGRVFVPWDDPGTVEQLTSLGFLPPRGATDPIRRVLNRLASPRSGRWAELGSGRSTPVGRPPAYVVDIARASGVDISAAPWALVAPGDYASQKVLLLLFDPIDRRPWTIVKLGADPLHAGRLRNEAAALTRLAELGAANGSVPRLRFAGEHAGRGVLGQGWIAGRPFTRTAEPVADSPQLGAATAWLAWLATVGLERRPAGEIGAALRDLLNRFNQIHRLPADETSFLEAQVRAVDGHDGLLPVVFQHGDPGVWNLLIDEDGTVAFLDWESAEAHGLPLWDLVHLQFSYGAWVARSEGVRRRLPASARHLTTATPLQARFTDDIAALSSAVDLPRSLVRPMIYTAWMHRALKEATRRTPATLERGLYRRLLRELIQRREEPSLRSYTASES